MDFEDKRFGVKMLAKSIEIQMFNAMENKAVLRFVQSAD